MFGVGALNQRNPVLKVLKSLGAQDKLTSSSQADQHNFGRGHT